MDGLIARRLLLTGGAPSLHEREHTTRRTEEGMARVGFIGVGNMGGPMARNLVKAGHAVKVYDLSEEAMNFAVQSGAKAAQSVKDAARGVEFAVTMLPVGDNVRAVFLNDGVLAA